MPDVILKDSAGSQQEYSNVKSVLLNASGSTDEAPILVEYTYGEAVSKTIEPDFSTGDMTVPITDGELVTEMTITKPEMLIPENIVKDVDIAGVVGTNAGGSSDDLKELIEGSATEIENGMISKIGQYAFTSNITIKKVSFPNCKRIEKGAFLGCSKLSDVSFSSEIEFVGQSAFYSTSFVSTSKYIDGVAYLNNILLVGSTSLPSTINILDGTNLIAELAFYNKSSIRSVYGTDVLIINSSAFYSCYYLNKISFPKCKVVEGLAFASCNNLFDVNLEATVSIGNSAFYNCTELSLISFPNCVSIGSYAFYRCAIQMASFPELNEIPYGAFNNCSQLLNANFPKCTKISSYAFYCCSNLYLTNFPICSDIGSYAFASCSIIHTLSFPSLRKIDASAFYNCRNLKSLYLLGSNYVYLYAQNALMFTPMSSSGLTGKFGSIYVRESMLSKYLTSYQWSYFSSRFVGLTDEEIAALEA